MLKIGGKEVIFSKSFLMAQGEEVVVAIPEIIARNIKITATRMASAIVHGDQAINTRDSDNQVTIDVPYADEGIFSFQIRQTQLNTLKGPVECRISGSALPGAYMLVHLDIHEGRFDNYVGD